MRENGGVIRNQNPDASELPHNSRCYGDFTHLKTGEVTQLAFTGDGQTLVAANEFEYFLGEHAGRKQCHSRLRSWATADWKLVSDTGELSVVGLYFAASSADSWFFQAKRFHRLGTGTSNPFGENVFYRFNPVTLERNEFDIQQGRDNRDYLSSGMACATEKSLCLFKLGSYGGAGDPLPPPFVFDLKSGKKTVDLQDYPTGKRPADNIIGGPALEFSPDGKFIASFQPSSPYQLQMHDSDTGKLLTSMKVHSAVGALQFSPNGKLLAAICQDGMLLILHADLSGQIFSKQVETFTFEKYRRFPRAITFVGDGHLAVMASDSKIELLDIKEWKSIRTFEGGKDRVNCVAASPDGKLLAAGFGETARSPGMVRVYNVEVDKRISELK